MLRNTGGTRGETRSSALWGTGSRGGESRSNALWGRGGRGFVLTLTAVFLLAIPLVATASNGGSSKLSTGTYIDANLLRLANTHPGSKIQVIIQSTDGVSAAEGAVKNATGGSIGRKLKLIGATSAEVPAARLKNLAKLPGLTITSDAPMRFTGSTSLNSKQVWPYEAGLAKLWGSTGQPAPDAPTIAVVDSGIQADRSDFGGRVLANVNLSTLPNNSAGDGRGHGTFVAGIAAGAAPGYAGAAPNAKIVSLDVMDDTGVAKTSDVIAACQWILNNKGQYNIRVANFSMHSTVPSNFTKDPLDKAVEKLWFSGVTVVAASGNYGLATGPSRVKYAPGNDPFVITVGAIDVGGTVGLGNDTTAPWSAYGYTYDGFWKPEIAAPGRYMVGPIPAGATLAVEKAANVTAPGYIQLSGTSFAAPAVAGAVAQILARHPGFTPDQVKGALMETATKAPKTPAGSIGMGELDAAAAANLTGAANPNRALNRFLAADPNGGAAPVFNAVAWSDAAKASVSWDAVAWSDVSWSSVAWGDVAWSDVAWSDVSWEDTSALADVAWDDVSWQDVSREDNAEGDAAQDPSAYALDDADVAELNADPTLAVAAELLPPSVAADTTATTTTTSATSATDTTSQSVSIP
jgi:serine protease AprX